MDFDEQNRPKKNRARNGLRSYTDYVWGKKDRQSDRRRAEMKRKKTEEKKLKKKK